MRMVSGTIEMRSPRSPRNARIAMRVAATATALSADVPELAKPSAVEAPEVVVCELEHSATFSENAFQVLSTLKALLNTCAPCFWRVRTYAVASAFGLLSMMPYRSSSNSLGSAWEPHAYSKCGTVGGEHCGTPSDRNLARDRRRAPRVPVS